jgi:hypothetical protein
MGSSQSQSQSYIATDGQSVSKDWAHDQIFIAVWQLQSCFLGALSLTRGWVCILYMLLVLASTVFFLGPSSLGFMTIFYCLRFEISLFVASYDSQGHSGGIRPCLHTVVHGLHFDSLVYSLWMDHIGNTTSTSSSIVALVIIVMWSVAMETCLQSHCLAMDIFSDWANPALSRYVTIYIIFIFHTKMTGCWINLNLLCYKSRLYIYIYIYIFFFINNVYCRPWFITMNNTRGSYKEYCVKMF